MIFDTLKNIENYKGLGLVYTALEFAAKTDFSGMELGRHELDGDNIYFMVQEYDTHKNTVSEGHNKYIDIQLLLSGEEYIGVAPIDCEKELVKADPDNDYALYNCEISKIAMRAGDFMVLYPNDLHCPGMAKDEPSKSRKIVFKVKAQ